MRIEIIRNLGADIGKVNEYDSNDNLEKQYKEVRTSVTGLITIDDHAEIEFSKEISYLPEAKRHYDFLIFRTDAFNAEEAFRRASMANSIGNRRILNMTAYIGAELKPKFSVTCEELGSCEVTHSADFSFTARLPLSIKDLLSGDSAEILDIGENFEGFYWANLDHKGFGYSIDNSSKKSHQSVSMACSSAKSSNPNLTHINWDRANVFLFGERALEDPTYGLGSMALRRELVKMSANIAVGDVTEVA